MKFKRSIEVLKSLAVAAGLFVLTQSSLAQEAEVPKTFIYATYYNCGAGSLSRADEITANDAPIMDKLVADGKISGWGYYAHHTGGQWQRLSYHTANSMDQLLDGGDAINDAYMAANAARSDADKAADEGKMGFGQICNRHDDYIWERSGDLQGGKGDKAAFSTYFLCDVSREERADEIVKEHVAPILNKLVKDGKLSGWGWASHDVGGQYRKLQTMSAPDHKTLLKGRAEALAAIYAEGNKAGKELTEICGAHTDYMWDVLH